MVLYTLLLIAHTVKTRGRLAHTYHTQMPSTNSCTHGHSFVKLWYNTKHKRPQLHYYSLDEGRSVLEVSIHHISDN